MRQREELINGLSESKSLSTKNPFRSYELAEEVLIIAKKQQYKLIEAEAYFHMAYACRVMSKYMLALEYALLALHMFKEESYLEGIVSASNIIGIVYFYHGDYIKANTYYVEALEILETIDQPITKSAVLNNLGELHRLSKQWGKANEYYFTALEIAVDHELKNNAAVIYSNIGEVYYNKSEYDNARKYLDESYKLAIEGTNFLARGEIENKLGMLEFTLEEYDKASMYYKAAYNHLESVDNKYYLIEVLINRSVLEENNEDQSLYYLNEALDIAIKLELHPKTSQIYHALAKCYENRENYKEALFYYKAYSIKEKEIEVDSLATTLNFMSLEMNYDKEKKESKVIRKLNKKFKTEIKKSHNELELIKDEYEQLLNENIKDDLTNIYNRRGIRKLLLKNTQNLENSQYVIFIIDIDYFKKYNDSLGHLQGDVCLAMIANKLNKLNYEDFFIGRFGGEEFLCYAKVNNIKEAKEIAEKIRFTVAELDLTYKHNNKINIITVSVGGKISDINGSDMNVIIKEADEALYLAKSLGRNQISVS